MARRRLACPGRRRLTSVDAASPDRLPVDRAAISEDLEAARSRLHALLGQADAADLRRRTNGTAWTNEQLLFHMVFGYLLVRNLLVLVRGFSQLPDEASRRFAATLNAGTRPFHTVNYLGSLGGMRVLGYPRTERLMDRTIGALQTSLDKSSEAELRRSMHFPVGWDPYFADVMTIRDVFHYPTQHYDHHRRQLTLHHMPG